MVTNSVTITSIKNTNCVICGKAFKAERAAKLYCSAKCRQSAYYHKDKIAAMRVSLANGISAEIFTFSLKEYKKYNHYREELKNYKKLEADFPNVQEGSDEWNFLYNNPCCALTFKRDEIPKKIFGLKPPYLSIEQWSFIKSIYPNFNVVDFTVFVCSLSHDFINQLQSLPSDIAINKNRIIEPIRNKYLFHLAKIANREVKFL